MMKVMEGNRVAGLIGQMVAIVILIKIAVAYADDSGQILLMNIPVSLVIAATLIVSLMIGSRKETRQPETYLLFLLYYLLMATIGKEEGLFRGASWGVAIYLILFVIYLYDTEKKRITTRAKWPEPLLSWKKNIRRSQPNQNQGGKS